MQLTGTFGMSSYAGLRPSKEQAEAGRKMLADRGFEVLHVGRFGIVVRAEAETFSRELREPITEARMQPWEVPQGSALRAHFVQFEMGPPPILLAGN